MADCRCGEWISPKRVSLGFKTCLKCGEAEAKKEIDAKSKRVAPDYNKGGYVYQGDAETAKRKMREGTGMKNVQLSIDPYINPVTTPVAKPNLKQEVEKKKRKAIGTYYLNGDAYVWYEGDDPKALGATRMARVR